MNKGNSSSEDRLPKFFKVYIPDDSGDDLELPISFNSCLPKHLPKSVLVISINGNVWKMKLRKCCGDVEKFVLVNVWKRIVKDGDLKGGEFLAFEFDGSWLFNICFYGQATCKKLGSLLQTKEIKDGSNGEVGRSSDDIIVIDDDDDDDDEEEEEEEDNSSEEIIVIDDDSDDDIEEES